MINWTRVKELEQDIGADDFSEVVDLFLEEVEEVMDRLKLTRNRANLAQDLHFLKGSALNLGFDQMGALCSDGEKQAERGLAGIVPLDQIVTVFDASKSEFLSHLA